MNPAHRPISDECRTLARRIRVFYRVCAEDEYTDTGEANELLLEAAELLERASKPAPIR